MRGWAVGEVFVLQVHAPGVEAEVDRGRAVVAIAGLAMTVRLFAMRASFSGAAFCQAALVETQHAFRREREAGEWLDPLPLPLPLCGAGAPPADDQRHAFAWVAQLVSGCDRLRVELAHCRRPERGH